MNRYTFLQQMVGLTLVGGLLAGCGAPTTPTVAPTEAVIAPSPTSTEVTIVPTDTPAPPTDTPVPPTPTLMPTPSEPVVTQVVIDGQPDDWANYEVVGTDPADDQVPGSPDLAEVRAFSNDQYFYLLISQHKDGDTDHYDILMDVNGGNYDYQLSVWPERNQAVFAAFPVTGSMSPLAGVTAAQDEVIEIKMPLSAVGGQPVRKLFVQTFLGDRVGDMLEDLQAVVVNETEPAAVAEGPSATPEAVSEDEPHTLARRFELPEGYVVERLFAPPAADLASIVRSQSGVIYLHHGTLSAGLSTLDPDSGEVTRILDLPSVGAEFSASGPGDTIFLWVSGEIRQVSPDGSYEVWGQAHDGWLRYYTPDGRMLGYSNDHTRVLEFLPDGSSREVASGFSNIYDIVASNDGSVFVSDIETGSITRVDPDGSQRVLAEKVLYRDPMDMEIDPDGNLYLNSVTTGFVRVDTETGTFTHYDSAHSPCAVHQADFILAESGRAIFVDPTWSQVTWADLNTGENGLLVANRGANTWAADIGPDDALYVGAWGCGDGIPAQVVRITDDGQREVYVDGLRGQVSDIAFAPDGGLYVATHDPGTAAPIFYISPEGGVPVQIPGVEGSSSLAVDPISGHLLATRHSGSSVLEITPDGLLAEHPLQLPMPVFDFFLDIAPDGTLYAYATEAERFFTGPEVERWVLRLDLESGSTEIIFQFNRQGCCVMGNLSVDPQGIIWWMVDPEFLIYRVTPDGEGTLFAQNLPIDPAAAVADSQGDVYFTSPSGIYRIYQEP